MFELIGTEWQPRIKGKDDKPITILDVKSIDPIGKWGWSVVYRVGQFKAPEMNGWTFQRFFERKVKAKLPSDIERAILRLEEAFLLYAVGNTGKEKIEAAKQFLTDTILLWGLRNE
jgi:hypothetical protein